MRNLLLAVFACGSLLQAGLVVPNGPWQQMTTPGVSGNVLSGLVNSAGNNVAYWNNDSSDADCSNIGCYVTKQLPASTSSSDVAYTNLSPDWDKAVWLGNNWVDNGPVGPSNTKGGLEQRSTEVTNFSFNASPSSPATLALEVAGLRDSNWFGWYDVNDPTNYGVIFNGTDDASAPIQKTATFTPSSAFGFWMATGWGGSLANSSTVVFTESKLNKNRETDRQYFALFAKDLGSLSAPPTDFVLGIEDTKNGDYDYNDMVIRFTVVPEPGFYGALALGLAGVYMAVRRKKA